MILLVGIMGIGSPIHPPHTWKKRFPRTGEPSPQVGNSEPFGVGLLSGPVAWEMHAVQGSSTSVYWCTYTTVIAVVGAGTAPGIG